MNLRILIINIEIYKYVLVVARSFVFEWQNWCFAELYVAPVSIARHHQPSAGASLICNKIKN